jgi:hypothetical protein
MERECKIRWTLPCALMGCNAHEAPSPGSSFLLLRPPQPGIHLTLPSVPDLVELSSDSGEIHVFSSTSCLESFPMQPWTLNLKRCMKEHGFLHLLSIWGLRVNWYGLYRPIGLTHLTYEETGLRRCKVTKITVALCSD